MDLTPAEIKEAVDQALPPTDLMAPAWLVNGYAPYAPLPRPFNRIAELEREVFAPIEDAIALGEQRAYTELEPWS